MSADLEQGSRANGILGPFWRHFFVERWRIALSIAAGLAAAALAAAAPWPVKLIIDGALLKSEAAALPASLARFSDTGQILVLALATLVIAASAALSSAIEKRINARLREGMTNRLRAAVVESILWRPLDDLRAFKIGDLVLRVIDDAGQVARLYCKTGPAIFRHAATTLFTLIAMIAVEPVVGAVGVGILIALSFMARAGATSLQRASRRKRVNEGLASAYVTELLRNQRFVRAAGGEADAVETFAGRNRESLSAGVAETGAAVNLEQAMQLANGAALALVVGVGGFLALEGVLTVGELTIALAYLNQLLKPVEKINELASAVTGALSRAERLSGFLPQTPQRQAASGARSRGSLIIEAVSFGYPDAPGRLLLNSASAQIGSRETIWLDGPSGCGKSTLIDILLRLREPQTGSISIDGRPAQEWPLTDWRAQFAVMLQDHFLFSGVVRDIVTFGAGAIGDEAVTRALRSAALDDFLERGPVRTHTSIDEAGGNLSGGQRARLCLARAIACERPILVLDEPLANLDAETKGKIVSALRSEKGRRTILIISHDEPPRDLYDRRLEFDGGRLVERARRPSPVVGLRVRS